MKQFSLGRLILIMWSNKGGSWRSSKHNGDTQTKRGKSGNIYFQSNVGFVRTKLFSNLMTSKIYSRMVWEKLDKK